MFNQFKLNLSIKREDLIIDKMKKEENLTLFAHKCKGGYVGISASVVYCNNCIGSTVVYSGAKLPLV